MQEIDGRHVFSATDLVGYLACEHLTNLDRAALAGKVARPHFDDAELDVIRRRGIEHERRYLADLVAQGRTVTEVQPDGYWAKEPGVLQRAADETAAAMQRGDDVIYQATFFNGRWLGFADFLLRVARPSALGDWSYEVTDTKLAHSVKASALLQMCSYVEQLTDIQRVEPEWMHVALGGSARQVAAFRVGDYMAYYRSVKARFEAAAIGTASAPAPPPAYPPVDTYPEPVDHCDVCKWRLECEARRRGDDHLVLVAGISGQQRKALTERGIATLELLAASTLPFDPRLEGVSPEALERVHEQARIQAEGRREGRVLRELLLPIEPDRGLSRLPAPSPGDLFFDIEGDPYALDDGLEYLFGFTDPSRRDAHGAPAFIAHWALDRAAEKLAFEAAIDLIVGRLDADPEMHVYHYAAYEPTAVKRLMGRHATREDQVDRLLRGGVFVDLHRVVRQSIRASVESYSIKKLEPLYGFTRVIDLRDAGSSIAAFEKWLQLGDEAARADDPDILARIEAYNRDDCVSTWHLRNWLEAERRELEWVQGLVLPRPGPADPEPPETLGAAQARVQALTERLTADVPADPSERTAEQQATWLLAQLLSWHRREEKSFWWNWYRMLDLTDEERIEDSQTLGGLTYEGVIREEGRSVVHRYRFPTQEYEVRVGGEARDPVTDKPAGTIVEIDEGLHAIDLKRGKTNQAPHPTSLVPYDYFDTREHRASVFRIGEWVADHGIDAPGPYRAARDLLLGRRPRVGQVPGAPLRPDDDDRSPRAAAARLGLELDATTLAIQGPPGSGKTSTAAGMIVALLAAGKRVGITANSHKVIGNLLEKVCEAATRQGVDLRPIQKADADAVSTAASVKRADSNAAVRDALLTGEANLAAGTAWLWSREEMTASVDVLFVDEAGQFSLANAVAVAGAATNVVLLGDPLQLDQPLQGTHPPGAEKSCLAHVLGDDTTMPADRGLFLERTHRLHPDLCRFTSEAFYDARLEPETGLEVQRLSAPDVAGLPDLAGTGIRYVAVPHSGNANESPDEAEVVARMVRSLVDGGATWTDVHGKVHPIGYDDILVVAPYNAHVAAIQRLLPGEARVGTVDKFQGQQAPVSIYSMATSTPEDAPRGMDFLYSRHRLNVATSRARCVAVLVCSPDLLRVRARTPEQMRLANAFAQLLEHAS